MTFDMASSTPRITSKTYSTHYKKFSGELPEYASWYRPHEQPKMTDAEFLAAEDFVITLADFRQRFDKTAEMTRRWLTTAPDTVATWRELAVR
jgi:hypothetical protein